jgi:hypothetical protein
LGVKPFSPLFSFSSHHLVSPFSLASVGGLQVGFESSDLTGSDGSSLTTWTDVFNDGNAPTQASGPAKPTVHTNQLNGFRSVRFDGSSQFLQTPSIMTSGDVSLFLIYRLITTGTAGTNDVIADGHTAGSAMALAWQGANQQHFTTLNGGTQLTDRYLDGAFAIVEFEFNGSSSNIWRNGIVVATGAGGAGVPDGITLGAKADGTRFTNIDVVAGALVQGISGGDRTKLLNYWAAKYGIPVASSAVAKFVFGTDSRTVGYRASGNAAIATSNYPFQLTLGPNVIRKNLGFSGQTWAGWLNLNESLLLPLYDGSLPLSVAVLWDGYNDTPGGGYTARQTADLAWWACDQARAYGFFPINMSEINTSGGGTQFTAYNGFLSGEYTAHANAFINLAGDSRLTTNTNDSSVWDTWPHLTALGYSYVANDLQATLNS